MALSANVAQFISQLGLLTLVDPSQGPKGPHGTVAYKLVPENCWINHQPFPHEVQTELRAQNYSTYELEGVSYFLVPDETSTNLPGKLAHYATTTAATDLLNPPGGGVNRTAETFVGKNAKTTTRNAAVVGDDQADAVSKYVKSTDNYDEATDRRVELDARVRRQIGHD